MKKKGAKLDFKKEKLQNLYHKIFDENIEVKSGKDLNKNKNFHHHLLYMNDFDNYNDDEEEEIKD